MKKMQIKILKRGPYLVTGGVPLTEEIIVPHGKSYEYKPGRTFPQNETYTLCRCGKSKNFPFCDGSHVHEEFNHEEVASKESFATRAELIIGKKIDLLDDHRCALARFCHRQQGEVWDLVECSENEDDVREAILGSDLCPSGRLVAREKDGTEHEPVLEPGIVILQDPEKGVSGPLYVRGEIPLVSADGTPYEIRNRITLCRCGQSSDMPFCDASHIKANFKDGHEKGE
jgi:CDGSH-type Zn-finger protein